MYIRMYIYIFLFLFVHFFTSLGTGTPKSLTKKRSGTLTYEVGQGATATNFWSEICWMFSFCFFLHIFLCWMVGSGKLWHSLYIIFYSIHLLRIQFETCQVSFLRRCVKFWNLELVCLVWLLASPQLWPCCRLFIRPLSLAWDRAPAWALAAIPSMAVGPRDAPCRQSMGFWKAAISFFGSLFKWAKKEQFVGWDVFFFSSFFFQSFFYPLVLVQQKKCFIDPQIFIRFFWALALFFTGPKVGFEAPISLIAWKSLPPTLRQKAPWE